MYLTTISSSLSNKPENMAKYQNTKQLHTRIIFLIAYTFFLLVPIQKITADSTDIYNLQPIIINSDFQNLKIDSFIKIWQTEKKLKPEDLLELVNKNDIDAAPHVTSQGFSFNYFWIVFLLKNESNKTKNLYIEIDNPHIDTIVFYSYNPINNHCEQIGYGGDMIPFYQRTILNRRFIFPIKLEKNEEKHFLLLIDKQKTSVSFPLRLWDQFTFNKNEGISNLLLHLYFGSLLLVALLTIIAGLLFRNWMLITYAIYASLMGLFIFTSLGFSFQFIYPNYYPISDKIMFPFAVILIIAFTEFSNSFIGRKQYSKKTHRILHYIYAISILNLSVWAIFHDYMLNFPGLLVSIQYTIILFFFGIIIYSLIRFYRFNKHKTISYTLAVSALILGFIFHLLIEYGYIEQSNLAVPPIMLGAGIELLIFAIAILIEIKKINDKKNELSLIVGENQRKITKAFIEGSEQEGTRISQELHDNIGSRLALLKNKITQSDTNKLELHEDLNNIYNDVKKLSHELSPSILQIAGFRSTIEQFLLDFTDISGIRTNLSYHKVPKLKENIELQLFRVIQESVQNCLRHSNANKLDIQIIGHENELIMTIDDDGNGFDISVPFTINGNGINNMKTRIESINGNFELSSTPNTGTFLLISIPI
ncbi:MAG: hypothetical protein DRJ10_02625 [Bacteroidetes bacterium]|nr:MAG: hypothetical protein DRJ10_02625 [Bacteroidota bacterium]